MVSGQQNIAIEANNNVTHQEHPLGIYFKVWTLLFVLSACSYMVDYLQLQGFLRWTLIIIFMLLKAGIILAIFMHMAWERMALITAVILPPLLLTFFIGVMVIESSYTNSTRVIYMGQKNLPQVSYHHNETNIEGSSNASSNNQN
ncbi:MAG: cytochrome c oxidase subunit IV [Cellvibrionaceae bacterium]|jgi:cytochrome c oxidase subunit IV